jgi:hypothetical protein
MRAQHHTAFVASTRNRREGLGELPASFSGQIRRPGLAIVVDGDDLIKDVCDANPMVPVEHLRCVPPGNVKHKNIGKPYERGTW